MYATVGARWSTPGGDGRRLDVSQTVAVIKPSSISAALRYRTLCERLRGPSSWNSLPTAVSDLSPSPFVLKLYGFVKPVVLKFILARS